MPLSKPKQTMFTSKYKKNVTSIYFELRLSTKLHHILRLLSARLTVCDYICKAAKILNFSKGDKFNKPKILMFTNIWNFMKKCIFVTFIKQYNCFNTCV